MQNPKEKTGKKEALKNNLKVSVKNAGMLSSKGVKVKVDGNNVMSLTLFYDGSIIVHSAKEIIIRKELLTDVVEWGGEERTYITYHLNQE